MNLSKNQYQDLLFYHFNTVSGLKVIYNDMGHLAIYLNVALVAEKRGDQFDPKILRNSTETTFYDK